jgi:hypothetical protein
MLTSVAVAALGIASTRSLALLTHDDSISVVRENGPELPSLLARIAPSFIRIGHFQALNPGKAGHNHHQFFLGNSGWAKDDAASDEGPLGGQGNLEGLRELTEWCQEVMGTQGGVKGWVTEVIKRNAEMVAGWQVSPRLADRETVLISGIWMDARSAKHRQYQCSRLDDRLWAFCIHGRLGRRSYLQYVYHYISRSSDTDIYRPL